MSLIFQPVILLARYTAAEYVINALNHAARHEDIPDPDRHL